MQTLLIVEPCDVTRSELEKGLEKDYCIRSCAGAEEAMALLREVRFDGLLVNLRLSGMDGLAFLEEMVAFLPPVILTLAPGYSHYTEQRLLDLHVAYPLLNTVPLRNIIHHVRSFMDRVNERIPMTAQETVSNHLHILGVPRQGGFDDLRVGTPLFAQAPDMSMTKEFYPTVAQIRGRGNWKQVEKAIRSAKEAAYAHRNVEVWKQYFPDTSECPTNKDFIARLAEFIS